MPATFRSSLLSFVVVCGLTAQDRVYLQSDFPKEEFIQRRALIMDAVGSKAIAVLQGAPNVDGFKVFRQTNEFYYCTGLEVPHALLVIDGRTRRSTLYLPHRDGPRDANEGKTLSAEDVDLVMASTGVDAVKGVDMFARDLTGALVRMPAPSIYTPLSPAERGTDSRDVLLGYQAEVSADPWDGRPSREGRFVQLLRERYPQFDVRDLSPTLDDLRSVKSAREIALIRTASRIAGWALVEAMRSTKPDVTEYQIDAVARYIYQIHGARREGYNSITAGGTNAWMGHYFRNLDTLRAGDMVLMDYAPDYRYYTSDVTRMWPVLGVYTKAQRQMADFILAYRNALLKRIAPGLTPDSIQNDAAREMRAYLAKVTFEKDIYRKAAEGALTFRGHLSHPVGLAVHDVGPYRPGPLKPGHVFSIDPMIWVPEEKLYVRMEDVIVVTATGVENFTDFLPSTPDEIQRTMKEPGVLQFRPPTVIR
ncbi:MAG: Xaa-Pro aminopeptidase [Bacteroidetes bacterium]|jgi:Xaa-Pro aminopeptidase|nr:Xaa-Pro aminopeptidase [Bacteroidota bacterium]